MVVLFDVGNGGGGWWGFVDECWLKIFFGFVMLFLVKDEVVL